MTLCRSTLELMGALVTSVLNEHADQAGLCAACGSAWLSASCSLSTASPWSDMSFQVVDGEAL